MGGRSFLITSSVVLVFATSACAPAELDWQDAQEQANEFTSSFETNPDALAEGSFSAGPSEPPLDEGSALGFEFADSVRIDEIRVACFGGGTAVFGAVSRSVSTWVGTEGVTVTCDGEVRLVPLEGPLDNVNAIELNGSIQSGGGAVIASAILGAVE